MAAISKKSMKKKSHPGRRAIDGQSDSCVLTLSLTFDYFANEFNRIFPFSGV